MGAPTDPHSRGNSGRSRGGGGSGLVRAVNSHTDQRDSSHSTVIKKKRQTAASVTSRHSESTATTATTSTTSTTTSSNASRNNTTHTTPVRIRDAVPPNPELLSQVGCRCLVIDLPGVKLQDLQVSYQKGFVRVQGQRTIGRVKQFRKKFSVNHDQIVPNMLSAFLSSGVLVVSQHSVHKSNL